MTCISVKPVQPMKAKFPIEVTPSEIVIEDNPVQSLKVSFPIAITLSPMVADFSSSISLNGEY